MRTRSYWGTTTERVSPGSSYQWRASAEESAMAASDPPLYKLIRDNVERGLACRGYTLRPGDAPPEFFISLRMGSGVQPSSAGPANMALLAVEAHAPDGRIIWRGWAEGTLDPTQPPEVRKARIELAICQILDEFRRL